MYTKEMLESMKKVEAARAVNVTLDPRRMTAEEKDVLLKTYHPDYKEGEFTNLSVGPNKGDKVPLELAAILQANPRINPDEVDLSNPDYDVDVLIIGGGGAGAFRCNRGRQQRCKNHDRHQAENGRRQHHDG